MNRPGWWSFWGRRLRYLAAGLAASMLVAVLHWGSCAIGAMRHPDQSADDQTGIYVTSRLLGAPPWESGGGSPAAPMVLAYGWPFDSLGVLFVRYRNSSKWEVLAGVDVGLGDSTFHNPRGWFPLMPLVAGTLANSMLFAVAIWAAVAGVRRLSARRTERSGGIPKCAACGYATNLQAATCAECGERFSCRRRDDL
jgi:hypothetical protein